MTQAKLLLKVAANDKTSVHNYSVARTYARNVIFNEYFNQPAASVIVFDDETKLIENTKDGEGNIISYGNYVELKTSETSAPVKVLATGGKIVMAVRSTSLDDKSGLHFITIDQSPLDENAKTYFANDTEKDSNSNYVNKTYISFYGKDKEKTSKDTLEKSVKTFIEKGVADSTALYDAALFELYFAENEDKITLADNISEILASYISALKAEYEEAFNDKLNASISTYVKSLNTFESFRTDAHYIPMGCIDENGEPVYATINGSNVRVCTRQDGRWVIREADPNEYKIKTTIEISGSATVNDNEIEVTEGNNKTVEITINDDYTLTGEAEKTALELFIDNEKFTINVDSLTDIIVSLEGNKLTIDFNNVKAEHKVEVKAAPVGGNE